MQIKILNSEQEVRRCYPIMKVLRPHLSEELFINNYQTQTLQHYKIAVVIDESGDYCALAGYRFCNFMAWGKLIYLDDLITDPAKLRRGYAGALLDWLEEEGKRNHCDALHLDSGYQRLDAHRLYLKKGWILNSHHFSKTL
jgi:GNAT superfamily N-acetyltransferase